jgi:hypothetical protein
MIGGVASGENRNDSSDDEGVDEKFDEHGIGGWW